MTVSADDLTRIESELSQPGADASVVAALRTALPHLSWSQCDASDVDEEPFRSIGTFDVHLLDGSAHCAEITADPDAATGVVLARRRTPA